MLPPTPPAVHVFGKWRDQCFINVPGQTDRLLAHLYDCNVSTPVPLGMGCRVQILALSPAAYHSNVSVAWGHICDVYDPHIVGRIVGVHARREDGMLVFAVENERVLSDTSVRLAVFTIPYSPGYTVMQDEDECPRAWMRKLLVGVRRQATPLLTAKVHGRLDLGETPVPVLRYPDPREDAPEPAEALTEQTGKVWRPWLV
ncbi:hypothetical protein OH76DRAFT_1419028 [Lentinus brumalis]|uniref:Uncharacterized protein n=1 Tax=Lentinus brumalis TaxID=2498619 RepID=A0A371D7P3_9APHY|nr:hypothetical protein OH76DRAFT_1419028 [Polyporus brumalis]